MRSDEEYEQILRLWEGGENKLVIARVTGIPRATVRDCITRYGSVAGLKRQRGLAKNGLPNGLSSTLCDPANTQVQSAYAYLLGLYLGDGEISRNRRIFRLRVALDKKYPDIIQSCAEAIETVLPGHQVGILDRPGCVNVSCYYKFWPNVFPQDGEGRKHEREIRLEPWQQQIVEAYPLAFFRGLYHSDGSRFSNVVNGKDYPRYSFTNRSEAICRMFYDTCDRLGLHWTVKRRHSGRDTATDIFISRRNDVAYLDRVVGPKS